MNTLLSLLVALLVVVLFVMVIFWLVEQIGLEPKTLRIAKAIIALIALILLLSWFFPVGAPAWPFRR